MQSDSLLTDLSNFSCSCSTCTCSNNSQDKFQLNYWKNHTDCLTDIFIILYESLIWCLEIIYEFFFKSFWEIFIYIKQEFVYNNRKITTTDSTLYETYNHRSSIKTDIVVIPVRSSYCQTEILIDRETCCKQNQTSFISSTHSSSTRQNRSDLSLFHHPTTRTSSNRRASLEYPANEFPSPNVQSSVIDQKQKKISEKKSKRKQRTIKNNIPLALSTSLHSNVSSYNTNYLLQKYVYQFK